MRLYNFECYNKSDAIEFISTLANSKNEAYDIIRIMGYEIIDYCISFPINQISNLHKEILLRQHILISDEQYYLD